MDRLRDEDPAAVQLLERPHETVTAHASDAAPVVALFPPDAPWGQPGPGGPMFS